MFDLGFMEMLVIGIIGLLVLGPERLPVAVRTVGLAIGRIKRGFADVQAQVEREIGADEIRQQLHNEKIMKDLEKRAPETSVAESLNRPASNVRRQAPAESAAAEPTAPEPTQTEIDLPRAPDTSPAQPAAPSAPAGSDPSAAADESPNRPHER
jgi:sec-independent protein translocase protein TatB